MIKIDNGEIDVYQTSKEEELWDFESMCYVLGDIFKFHEFGKFKDKRINELMRAIIIDCKAFNKLLRDTFSSTNKTKIKHNGEKFGQVIQFPQKEKKNNDKD